MENIGYLIAVAAHQMSEIKLQSGGGLHPPSPEGEYSGGWLKRLSGKDVKTRRTRED